jgi:hypothetical protein
MKSEFYYRPIQFSDLLEVVNSIGALKKTTPLLRRVISISDCLKFGAASSDLISISRPIELTQRYIDLNSISEQQKFTSLLTDVGCISETEKSREESRYVNFISGQWKIRLQFDPSVSFASLIGGVV